jgi:hypothetical protein
MILNKKKRVLWLCNHATLLQTEVPLLRRMGFEVFIPKIIPDDDANKSTVVSFEHDKTLSINADDLKTLNEYDFYTGKYSEKVHDIINSNFQTAIFTCFPGLLKFLIKNFNGLLLMRVFGREKDFTYWDAVNKILGSEQNELTRIKNRFFLSVAYDNIAENEKGFFRNNSIFMPLGIPDSLKNELEGIYKGTENQIFFVCPRIKTSSYYHSIYNDFKCNFGKLPHVIGGMQPKPVKDDDKVSGFLNRDEFNSLFSKNKVMFYHSQEPRHLHYHPIEAITAGMPLVFMRGGMLDFLDGKNLPGRCQSVKEARKKIKAILRGDKKLTNEIITSQKIILKHFDEKYVESVWMQNFLPMVDNFYYNPPPRKKIAIIMSFPYRGGTLNAFKQILKQLILQDLNLTVGLPADYFDPANDLYYPDVEWEVKNIVGENVVIRKFNWRPFTDLGTQKTIALANLNTDFFQPGNYAIPDDGINCFMECDEFIYISDRFFSGAPVPLKPYSLFTYDYLQRYLKQNILSEQLENTFFNAARNARYIFYTNQGTLEDIVNYAGVAREKCCLMPFEFDFKEAFDAKSQQIQSENKKIKNYFIWPCNLSSHKNHLNILKAITYYYSKLDGKLDVYITGHSTQKLYSRKNDDHSHIPHLALVRKYLNSIAKRVLKKIHFKGEMPRDDFLKLLSGANFSLLSSINDNGAFAAVESAIFGVPHCAARYPAMEYFSEYFKINTQFYNPDSPVEIAHLIKKMETNRSDLQKQLPSLEYLESCSYNNQHEWISRELRKIL